MSSFRLRPAEPRDNDAVLRLLAVPQPSSGVMLAFERAPDYFHSVGVSHEQPGVMVAERSSDGEVVGVMNLGSRRLFLNGEVANVRYGSDLRIATALQGSRLIIYINRAVREMLQDTGWYQAVILEDNQRTREVLEGARAGLPLYKPHVGLTTWTLSGRKRRANAASPEWRELSVKTASAADIPAMNAFVQAMAAHYQFLPAYDFSALLQDSAYFKGLTLDDFLLVSDGSRLRGLVALWNQKAFKQTRVVAYHPALLWLRPLYNVWARLVGGFMLPPTGECFRYRVLHSLLTAPEDMAAMDALLDAAWDESRRRDQGAPASSLTLTLADGDPRRAALSRFRSLTLRGRHYTVAFNDAAHPELDNSRIPYFECGRL